MPRKAETQEASPSFMSFDSIKDRESDTRKLKQKHVDALALSIAEIGLIEPLVVDQDGVLLAGGHRRAAIYKLTDGNQKPLDNLFPSGIPVRVMSFSSADDPDKALKIEIAENEHRRDYTAKEIQAVSERLKDVGFKELKGRPRKGEKSLMEALEAVVGKSRRQLRRIINEESRTNVHLLESNTYLRRAIANLEKWQKADNKKPKELSEQVARMLSELEKGITM